MVSYVLNTIAPSQQEQLWEGVVKRHCSSELKINNITIDVGLEAILLAYNECSNRSTKRESGRFSQLHTQSRFLNVEFFCRRETCILCMDIR